MKIKVNNNELVAVLEAIEIYLEYEDNKMIEASLESFLNKLNNEMTIFNREPEERILRLREQLQDLKEFRKMEE